MAMRFLPSQEWSSKGRGIGGVFGGECGRECGGEGLSPLEIPAFAGMVFRGTGNRRRIRQIVAHELWIPAFAGMVFRGTGDAAA